MELRRLRYFVTTAEELHFGRASERLGISQPPLSIQIKALERDLGVELFKRDRRNVTLTAAGAMLLREGRALLTQADKARDLVRRAARGDQGKLAIGFITPVEYSFLPSVLRRYRRQFPGVDLQLREAMTDSQISALRNGSVDVGILTGPVADVDIDHRLLMSEPVVAAIPTGHPLASGSSRVSIRRFTGEDVVMFPRAIAPELFDEITAWCRAAGFTLQVAQETPRTQTIISLVSAGLGLAIVPGSIRNLRRKGVCYRDFRERPPLVRICVAWAKRNPPPPARNFISLVQAACGSH